MATGKSTQALKAFGSAFVTLAWGKDGKILFGGNADKSVAAWDLSKAANARTLRTHRMAMTDMAFSPDGSLLATASYDKTVKLWNVASGREWVTLRENEAAVLCVAFSPNNRLLALGCGNDLVFVRDHDNSIMLWTLDGIDTMKQPILTLSGHTKPVQDVVFSPDSMTLASASMDTTVVVWDALTGQKRVTLDSKIKYVVCRSANCVAFSPNGEVLASGSEEGAVRFWNMVTHQVQGVLRYLCNVSGVAFSSDGGSLAASWGNYRKPQDVALTDLEFGTRTNSTDGLLAGDLASAVGWPVYSGAIPGPSFHHHRDGETVIALTRGGHPHDAFYPATIMTTHPSGRIFAGCTPFDTNVHIVVLEGHLTSQHQNEYRKGR